MKQNAHSSTTPARRNEPPLLAPYTLAKVLRGREALSNERVFKHDKADMNLILHRLKGLVWLCGARLFALAGLTAMVAVVAVPMPAHAQALDVMVDATIGTGVTRYTTDQGGVQSDRSPTYLDIDTGLVFDGDFTSEWGLGVMIQLDQTTAIALSPQVRLVRPIANFEAYVGAGVPLFVSPNLRLGGAFDVGARWPITDVFALSGGSQIAVYFAGDDLDGDARTVFNFSFGGQARF